MLTSPVPSVPRLRRAPWFMFASAWAVPVLVVGQFALLAAVPVTVLVIATLTSVRVRAMRWWVGALAVAYAIPLLSWMMRPDAAESLSKDLHPVSAALILAVSIGVIIKLHTRRKR